MVGDGARALVQRALAHTASPAHPAEHDALLERMSALFLHHYADKPVVHTTLLPGAREALALGLPAALVTNKPRAVSVLVLEQLGIASSFRAVFAGGDGPLKPSPHGVQKVAEELGVPLHQAWLVGDGPQDVLAGRAAGCFTIAVPGIAERERVLAAEPHLVVDSLLDVARLARQAGTRLTSA
jgi:phosphoglycolate phosphatase